MATLSLHHIIAVIIIFLTRPFCAATLSNSELVHDFAVPAEGLQFDRIIEKYHSANEKGKSDIVKHWVRMHLLIELPSLFEDEGSRQLSTVAALIDRKELRLLHRLLKEGLFWGDSYVGQWANLFKNGIPSDAIIEKEELEDLVHFLISPRLKSSKDFYTDIMPGRIKDQTARKFIEAALKSDRVPNMKKAFIDKALSDHRDKLFSLLDHCSGAEELAALFVIIDYFNACRCYMPKLSILFSDNVFVLIQMVKANMQFKIPGLCDDLELVLRSESTGLRSHGSMELREALVQLLGVSEYRRLALIGRLTEPGSYMKHITTETDGRLLKTLATQFASYNEAVSKLFADAYLDKEKTTWVSSFPIQPLWLMIAAFTVSILLVVFIYKFRSRSTAH